VFHEGLSIRSDIAIGTCSIIAEAIVLLAAKFVPPGEGRYLSVRGKDMYIKAPSDDTDGAFGLWQQTHPQAATPVCNVPPVDAKTYAELRAPLVAGFTARITFSSNAK
jgi:hypothetical protein